jgi:hypothetical protein
MGEEEDKYVVGLWSTANGIQLSFKPFLIKQLC